MGLTAFNKARREAAERANVPAEELSYDEAIASLAQPLLTSSPAPAAEPEKVAEPEPRPARKPRTKAAE